MLVGWSWWKQIAVRHYEKNVLLVVLFVALGVGTCMAFYKVDEKYTLLVLGLASAAMTALVTLLNNLAQQKRQTDEVREERGPRGEKMTTHIHSKTEIGEPGASPGVQPVEVINRPENPVPTEEAPKEKKP